MIDRKLSTKISIALCFLFSAALVALLFIMPKSFALIYSAFGGETGYAPRVAQTVVPAFYVCAPFSAAALYMMLKILFNVLSDRVFIAQNVRCFRYMSWCCYAVMIIAAAFCLGYLPLFIVTVLMALIGTLLRVVKNILQSAVELREENDLTI